MKTGLICIVGITFAAAAYGAQPAGPASDANAARQPAVRQLKLGEPNVAGILTVEQAITQLKNVRRFSTLPLDNSYIRQLVWAGRSVAAQTTTAQNAAHLIDLYFCLPTGVYRYDAASNTLNGSVSGDVRTALANAAQSDSAILSAPCTIIIAGSSVSTGGLSRTETRDMTLLEAGKAAQSIALQAQSLELGTSGVALFNPAKVKRIAGLPAEQDPLYIMAVGFPFGAKPKPLKPPQQRAVFIIPGSGQQTDELFNVMDVLNAAGIKTTVAMYGRSMIRYESYQRAIEPDMQMRNVAVNDYDVIIIIGGLGDPGFLRDPVLLNIIRTALNNGKIVAAAGTSTTALVNAGVVNGVRVTGDATVFMGSGAIYTGNLVQTDRNIVTSISSQQASLFAKTIIEALKAQTEQQQPPPQPQPPTPTMQRMY